MAQGKSGKSRRMTKQGPPPSLDDLQISKKRKLDPSTNGTVKRARKGSAPRRGDAAVNGNSAGKTQTKGTFKRQSKPVQPVKKLDPLADDEDEDDDDDDEDSLSSGMRLEDLDDDEMDEDADDFANAPSGDEDDDVLDSDQEVHQKGVWSEDDDSDAEEKLTAANIAGLSARLDQKREQDEADAEAELAEDTIRTNIAADIPMDDEDDEEGGVKTNQLAPDLQLLRTRITETVRVLTSFKELHDPSRSRTDYTQALLKDIYC
nr:25s rrna (cytosine-c(5))-methyltransferase nop2 [Quercus suber]